MSTFFLITSWQMLSEDDPSLEERDEVREDVDKDEASVKGREEADIRLLLLKRERHGLRSLVGFGAKEWERRRLEVEEDEELKVVRRFWLEVVIVTGEKRRERTDFYRQQERGEEVSKAQFKIRSN